MDLFMGVLKVQSTNNCIKAWGAELMHKTANYEEHAVDKLLAINYGKASK